MKKVVLILTILLQSCFFSDETCYVPLDNEVTIYFDYSKISPEKVNSINLYVFTSQEKFVLAKYESNIALNDNYSMTVKLPPGSYIFTAWCNVDDPYYVLPAEFSSTTDINTASLNMKRPTSNVVTAAIPDLFFGQKQESTMSKSIVRIPLVQNTNKVNLTIKGLTPSADILDFTITDNNSKYTFYNIFAFDSYFDYHTSLTNDAEPKGTLNVLRLAENRQAQLSIMNSTQNQLLYSHDLIDLLKKFEEQAINIDWINTHEFDIVLTFDTNLEVEIIINGWHVIVDETQLP